MTRDQYRKAYQSVRLKRLAAQANAEYDYTTYDGWHDEGDGYNDADQSKDDWIEAIDREIYEMQQRAEDAQRQLDELTGITDEMIAIADDHWYTGKYVRDPYLERPNYRMLKRRG